MFGILIAIIVSVILPIVAFIYAILKRRWLPFILGILAFTISQLLLRIPLLDYLQTNNASFILLAHTRPIIYSLILGFSAGIFEEVARYILMKFIMKQRDWKSGFLFGLGHGGIEAIIFVGVGAVVVLGSPVSFVYGAEYFIGGVERIFALIVHVSLSIIVLRGVVDRKLIYLFIAIFIHGFTNSLIGIIPLYIPGKNGIIITEIAIAFIAFIILIYSLLIKRKGILQ